MKLIWKDKLFWREETHDNRLYMHPILAFGSIVIMIIIGVWLIWI